jgi:hypothetical protein
MKHLTAFLFTVALAAPLVSSAADFEGKVTMEMTGQRQGTVPMTFSLKSGMSRIDMQAEGHTAAMIFDAAKHQMTILMPQQKMYMVRPIPQPGEAPQGEPEGEAADVQATNEHEKILGYDTTKYTAKTKEGTSEIWITDQLGTFMGLGSGGNPMFGGRPGRNRPAGHAWESAFRGKDAFPLRVVTTNADGKQTFKMEAKSIDKTALPASLFAPPSDYQELDIGAMMRGMGGPGGMRPHSGD